MPTGEAVIRRRWLSAGLLSVILALPLAAAGDAQTLMASRAWSRFIAANPGDWRMEWSASGDQAVSLRGRSRPASGDPLRIAAAFIAENADVLGLPAGRRGLGLKSQRRSDADTHVTYRQAYGGLPVFNGFVDVHLNAGGQVYLVHNNSVSDTAASALSLQPQRAAPLAAASAQRLAHRFFDKRGVPFIRALRAVGQPELGIQRMESGAARLAYRVDFGAVEYVMDANTGALLDTTIFMQTVKGTGKVFDLNPVNTLNDKSLGDRKDRNYAALKDAYFSRALKGIKKTGAGAAARYRLIGPYVKTLDLKASAVGTCMNGEKEIRQAPPVRKNKTFLYNRSQNGFEHTMVYFHLDKNQRYVQSRGFDDLFNAPIRVDAHAITIDNSFYCGRPVGAGYLAFGDGGVDDAEDADVVLHEYGHALQDAASDGRYLAGGQTGAMGEGFSDFWAFSAKASGPWAACFAEWDTQGGCLRRLDKNKRFPRDYVGQVHTDGEIWSRGLRDLLIKIGKSKADRIILKSHFLVPNKPKFRDGLQALLDADQQIFAGANKAKICAVFQDRGINAPGC